MLKGAKPWIGLLDAAQTGGVVQVDPAPGTKATTLSPAEGLKRQIQQDVFAQKFREIEAIVSKHIHVHLRSGQLDLLSTKGTLGSKEQDRELIRHRDGNRF